MKSLALFPLRHGGAVAAGVFSALLGLAAVVLSGTQRAPGFMGVVSAVTQGVAFMFVTALVLHLSRQLRHERTLRRQDPLTGLLNRAGFTERAQQLLPLCRRHVRPVTLAYLDLDHFKRANDFMGHAYGDRLLQRCGEIIGSEVRQSDVAARIGGDEFVILLPGADHASALAVCNRIRSDLLSEAAFSVVGVGISIGVVTDDQAQCDIATLLRRADAQMYSRKRPAASSPRPAELASV